MKDYPPAPIIHSPACRDVPPMMIPQAIAIVALNYPNGVPHDCVSPHDPRAKVVVVPMEWPVHEYKPTGRYTLPDAVRALCDTCRSTHGLADSLIIVTHGS
ncbi:hypothetical protein [Actinoplanes sp. NPDC051851]|uniref:hypothetical protein n=1 Tax=Actinoplanes sp. NPDC051851 TaxID=3154753 RepID=UPI00341EC116